MNIGGSGGNAAFTKAALTFSILTMFLMGSFLAVFLPVDYDGDMADELDTLTEGYVDMTGSRLTSEEIWGLTGIYTPYGKDRDGNDSTAWLTTKDGWVAGARVVSYSPSQYQGTDFNNGAEAYTVTYDSDTGLYYYTEAGSDLSDIVTGTVSNPEEGSLYTAVAMDKAHQSDMFFTSGGRIDTDKGSYYPFSGWRYVWQPLRDYKAAANLDVDRTTTSLSCVWYDYYGTSGISSQLMLAGDQGVSYITTKEITESFDSASFSSKFQMKFNGITMNIYIKLNPYAIQFQGKSPAKCFDQGYWSMMVTSPAVATDTSGFTLSSLSPERVLDIVINLLTFDMDKYGLSGVASILCSIFFSVGFYTSLIAICLEKEYLLILLAILGVVQGIGILL